MENKFKFQDKVSSGKYHPENTLRYDYTKKYGYITGNINHTKNAHGIKEITIFYKDYEGIQLLKNANKITIIKPYRRNKIIDEKIKRRINKLNKINKNVDIIEEEEIKYGGGGGLIQLIAYGRQDSHIVEKPKITHFKTQYVKTTNCKLDEIVETNNYKVKSTITEKICQHQSDNYKTKRKSTKKIYQCKRNNKINKNANKFRNSGR